jgi:hypothetical protein
MSCKYCDDTGLIKDMPCPDVDCVVGKAFRTQLTKYQEKTSETIVVSAGEPSNEPAALSEIDRDKMLDAVHEIRELTIDAKEKKTGFDLLCYRYKDNGLILGIYGPKENQDKIIERLEEVIKKYKKRGILNFSGNIKPKKVLPLPTDKGFNFRKLLGK